ncbi:uncharacterized protein LOC118881687 [Balaenoptera musculus]|uniref:Uncharacterized protein LOC118881687 n=1 Tax=Balaenoptera musculus TaxID=9771 RepID=A0A8B8VCT9_BALMU|nr:uncharacterized protein LOC118881687 [Balaenoptera musculus]
MFSRFIHVVACFRAPSLLGPNPAALWGPTTFYLSQTLGCLHPSAAGDRGAVDAVHVFVCAPVFSDLLKFQIRKRRLPSPGCALEQRAPPGGLQPRQPGQARPVPRSLGAWKPEKPGGLSARCPGDARGAASLSQCQDLAGPSTAASSQTRLRSLNRAIVVPAPRTPSWTRLAQRSCLAAGGRQASRTVATPASCSPAPHQAPASSHHAREQEAGSTAHFPVGKLTHQPFPG